MRFSKGLIGILLALLIGGFTLTAIGSQVAIGTKGMVASAKELASEAGAQILASGGNAVDAACRTSGGLSVLPSLDTLGGDVCGKRPPTVPFCRPLLVPPGTHRFRL